MISSNLWNFLVFNQKYINEVRDENVYALPELNLGKNYLDIKLSYDTYCKLCVHVRLMEIKKSLYYVCN